MKQFILLLFVTLTTFNGFAQTKSEQETIKNTFFGFLKYYQEHEEQFQSFQLYKGSGEDGMPPYHIQWDEAEKYFNFLRKNVPFVGESYIERERAHFKYADSCFKVFLDEEMPIGFDYDRWAGGQESIEITYVIYTDTANKHEIIIKGDKAIFKIGFMLSDEEVVSDWNFVPFKKENGIWKMADNIYPFSESNLSYLD